MPALFCTHSFDVHTWAPAPQARLAKVAFAPPAAQPSITELKTCETVVPLGQSVPRKYAVTLCACVIVTVQVPRPLQAGVAPAHPPQPQPIAPAPVTITAPPLS